MQPTISQTSADTADTDSPAVHPVECILKKDPIYLLAQFWQQRAVFAENEIFLLKEKLCGPPVSAATSADAEIPPSGSNTPPSSPTKEIKNSEKRATLSNDGADFIQTDAVGKENEMHSNRIWMHQKNIEKFSTLAIGENEKKTETLDLSSQSCTNKSDDEESASKRLPKDKFDHRLHPGNEDENDSFTAGKVIGDRQFTRQNNPDKSHDQEGKYELNDVVHYEENDDSGVLNEELITKQEEIKLLIEKIMRLKALHTLQVTQIHKLEEVLEAKDRHILWLEGHLQNEHENKLDIKEKSGHSPNQATISPQIFPKDFCKEKDSCNELNSKYLPEKEKLASKEEQQYEKELLKKEQEKTLQQQMPLLNKRHFLENNNNNNNLFNLFDSYRQQNEMLKEVPLKLTPPDGGNYKYPEDPRLRLNSLVSRYGDSLIPTEDPMEAKLQEMLRYNIEKYANENLNTLHISRRVRELLSVHNIGQRLFAKYVLGLSQGTVSELLSKPKPWDKLTEKGRDSYRKMHAWAYDDGAVFMLKSLVPKKSQDFGEVAETDNSNMPDMLNVGKYLRNAEYSNPSRTPDQNSEQCGMFSEDRRENPPVSVQKHFTMKENVKSADEKISSNIMNGMNQSKNNQERIAENNAIKVYQNRLTNMLSNSTKNSSRSNDMPTNVSNFSLMEAYKNENARAALESYYYELTKLQQNGMLRNFSEMLSAEQYALNMKNDMPAFNEESLNNDERRCPFNEKSNTERCSSRESSISNSKPSQIKHSDISTSSASSSQPMSVTSSNSMQNTILPPVAAPVEEFSPNINPLQRMASITNSLLSQPPVIPHHMTQQRPSKSVLPPITQQQFDTYNNLNTEEIVRQVKESLSQYSISQRLFGESVLGLSQGSVSDLLARPKPWHMLTQKGREPFIRMKMFLEDDNAVHKLVASQYKIAPEKLMRTGNYDERIQNASKGMNANINLQESHHAIKPENEINYFQGYPIPQAFPMYIPFNLRLLNERRSLMMPGNSQQQTNATPSPHQNISSTVYEAAAMTPDMDTQMITTRIKEVLLSNNIGQKIFGEMVLGLSQGSVSELLSKPKPWHMLSIKGREPFIRMQMWLSDPNNVERLRILKNEYREANKRRRSTEQGSQDNTSDTSSTDNVDYNASSPSGASVSSSDTPPSKKQRILFTEEQKEALRLAYELHPYPNVSVIEFLANELGLPTRTVTNWFHNHRMRLKQQISQGIQNESVLSWENTNEAPFNPMQFKILLSQRLSELQNQRMTPNNVNIYPPAPPYFPSNPDFASLIDRNIFSKDMTDPVKFYHALREQMCKMESSQKMGEDKKDVHEIDDPEYENISDKESSISENDLKYDLKKTCTSPSLSSKTSKRKSSAPQWVNPDWQSLAPMDALLNKIQSPLSSDGRNMPPFIVSDSDDNEVKNYSTKFIRDSEQNEENLTVERSETMKSHGNIAIPPESKIHIKQEIPESDIDEKSTDAL